jgi:hypothetical protein
VLSRNPCDEVIEDELEPTDDDSEPLEIGMVAEAILKMPLDTSEKVSLNARATWYDTQRKLFHAGINKTFNDLD